MIRILIPCLCSFLVLLSSCVSIERTKSRLPEGVSYLSEIAPTVIESPRYFGSENFLGRRVEGYESGRIVCSTKAAQAIARAQKEFEAQGYSLVIYDAYRPQRAVNEFMRWSTDTADQNAKTRYYPTIDKKDVFDLGYVAKRSGHSRGSTLDLTLIKLNESVREVKVSVKTLTDGTTVPFLDDNTLDMGSSFDLFHPVSHHDTNLINEIFTKRRNLLRSVMKSNGFKEYSEEWWHYTLADEPFADTYFDFVVAQ